MGRMRVASRTVLIVDDDASLRQALESVLVGMGYRVVTAGSPDTAYALLRSEPVDAALLDVRLPTMSGLASRWRRGKAPAPSSSGATGARRRWRGR